MEALWDAPKGSLRADELEQWAALVEVYEEKHHPVAAPDPIEAVKFRMEQMGLKPSDMAKIMGGEAVFRKRLTVSARFR